MHRSPTPARPPERRSRPFLLVVLALLALFAAACGDDSGDAGSGDGAGGETTDDTSSSTTLPSTTAPIPESGEALDVIQLNIVEFGDETAAGFIEIVNTGAESVSLAGVNVCQSTVCVDLADVAETLGAGEALQVPAETVGGLNVAGGEVSVHSGTDTASADALLSYVQWGSGGYATAAVAVEAGLWPSVDDFVTPDPAYTSIESGGFAADPEGWS
ncbi:MAG: hypothetical protein RIB98_13540 [Acidimicrobiales bacterium]